MKTRKSSKKPSTLRELLKREDAASLAKLPPAQRLQGALDLSDFCRLLATKTQEADAQRSLTKGRHGAR